MNLFSQTDNFLQVFRQLKQLPTLKRSLQRLNILTYLIAIALPTFLLLGCGQPENHELKNQLIEAIVRENNDNSDRAILNIAEITDFAWERLYIFTPYTGTETIEETLGFKWATADSVKLYERDDINLLVFVNNSQVVEHLELTRINGDFAHLQNYPEFQQPQQWNWTPETANFMVKENESGNLIIDRL